MPTSAPVVVAIGDIRSVSIATYNSQIISVCRMATERISLHFDGDDDDELFLLPFLGPKDVVTSMVIGDLLHLMWDGVGQDVTYARWNLATNEVDLVASVVFAGTVPSLQEYYGGLIAHFINPASGDHVSRRSTDGGTTWGAENLIDTKLLTDGAVEHVDVSVSPLTPFEATWINAHPTAEGSGYLLGFVTSNITITVGPNDLTGESASNNNPWIARVINGSIQWASLIGSGRNTELECAIVDPLDGGIIAAGRAGYGTSSDLHFYNKDGSLAKTLSLSAGTLGLDVAFACKYDRGGDFVWGVKMLDPTGTTDPAPVADLHARATGIGFADDGDVLITGPFGVSGGGSIQNTRLVGDGEVDEQEVFKQEKSTLQWSLKLNRDTGLYALDSHDIVNEKVLASSTFIFNPRIGAMDAYEAGSFSDAGETVAHLSFHPVDASSEPVQSYDRGSEIPMPNSNAGDQRSILCKWDDNHDALWNYEVLSSPSSEDMIPLDSQALGGKILPNGDAIFMGKANGGTNKNIEFADSASGLTYTTHDDEDIWVMKMLDNETIDWAKSTQRSLLGSPRTQGILLDVDNDFFYVAVRLGDAVNFGDVIWGTGEGAPDADSFDFSTYVNQENSQGWIAKYKISDGTFVARTVFATMESDGRGHVIPGSMKLKGSGVEVALSVVSEITIDPDGSNVTLSATVPGNETIRRVEFDSDLDYVSDNNIHDSLATEYGVPGAVFL